MKKADVRCGEYADLLREYLKEEGLEFNDHFDFFRRIYMADIDLFEAVEEIKKYMYE